MADGKGPRLPRQVCPCCPPTLLNASRVPNPHGPSGTWGWSPFSSHLLSKCGDTQTARPLGCTQRLAEHLANFSLLLLPVLSLSSCGWGSNTLQTTSGIPSCPFLSLPSHKHPRVRTSRMKWSQGVAPPLECRTLGPRRRLPGAPSSSHPTAVPRSLARKLSEFPGRLAGSQHSWQRLRKFPFLLKFSL